MEFEVFKNELYCRVNASLGQTVWWFNPPHRERLAFYARAIAAVEAILVHWIEKCRKHDKYHELTFRLPPHAENFIELQSGSCIPVWFSIDSIYDGEAIVDKYWRYMNYSLSPHQYHYIDGKSIALRFDAAWTRLCYKRKEDERPLEFTPLRRWDAWEDWDFMVEDTTTGQRVLLGRTYEGDLDVAAQNLFVYAWRK